MVVVPQEEDEDDEDGEHGGHVPHTPYDGQSDNVASDDGASDEVDCPLAVVRVSSSTGITSLATIAVS